MAAPLYSTSITALLLALSIAFCLYNVLKKEDAPDGKIYTHINTLKKVFSNFPAYRIEKKKGKHYALIVDTSNKHIG